MHLSARLAGWCGLHKPDSDSSDLILSRHTRATCSAMSSGFFGLCPNDSADSADGTDGFAFGIDPNQVDQAFSDWTAAELEALCAPGRFEPPPTSSVAVDSVSAENDTTETTTPCPEQSTAEIEGLCAPGDSSETPPTSSVAVDNASSAGSGYRSNASTDDQTTSEGSQDAGSSDSGWSSGESQPVSESSEPGSSTDGSQSLVDSLELGDFSGWFDLAQPGLTDCMRSMEARVKRGVLRQTISKTPGSSPPAGWLPHYLARLNAASKIKLRGLEPPKDFNPFEAIVNGRATFGDARGFCPLCGLEAGVALVSHMKNHMHMAHNTAGLGNVCAMIHTVSDMGYEGFLNLEEQRAVLGRFLQHSGEYNSAWKHRKATFNLKPRPRPKTKDPKKKTYKRKAKKTK